MVHESDGRTGQPGGPAHSASISLSAAVVTSSMAGHYRPCLTLHVLRPPALRQPRPWSQALRLLDGWLGVIKPPDTPLFSAQPALNLAGAWGGREGWVFIITYEQLKARASLWRNDVPQIFKSKSGSSESENREVHKKYGILNTEKYFILNTDVFEVDVNVVN